MKSFKLLIAYDGSECSKEALVGLQAAGLPQSLDAVVFTAADVWIPIGPPLMPAEQNWLTEAIAKSDERKEKILQNAKKMAAGAADVLRRRFPGWTIRSEGRADTPAWGVVALADRWKPDLVVLGSSGRSAMNRFFIGSVSQQVLTHVACSVRITHTEPDPKGPRRLILAFDGSADAKLAATRLAERPWPRGTRVRIVSVIDSKITQLLETGLPLGTHPTRRAQNEFWDRQALAPVLKNLEKAGLNVEGTIRFGRPVHALLREAKRWHANGIFLGARGLSAVNRFLMGSVSTRIAAKAPCTVEVVR